MPTRRAMLRQAAAVLALPPLAACRRQVTLPPGAIRVPLADVPEGGRTVVMRGEEPVELTRIGGAIRARSLFCTHMGCRVRWDGDRQRYLCPCHGGAFDAEGQPVAGEPREALQALGTALERDAVIILPRGIAAATPNCQLPTPNDQLPKRGPR